VVESGSLPVYGEPFLFLQPEFFSSVFF
jgi:hypothetical protein